MIHELINQLLDIEESSEKGINFSYSSYTNLFTFYLTASPSTHTHWLSHYSTCNFDSARVEKEFSASVAEIERVKNLPPVEPKVKIEVTEARARELGLIA